MLRKILIIGSLLILTACQKEAPTQPSVLVQTILLQQKTLSEKIVGYGVVSADPMHTFNVSLANAGQVMQLYVIVGQRVAKGAPLFVFATDPSAYLAYSQNQNALTQAKNEVARTQELLAQHLATNAQLAAAEKNLQDAEQTLSAQQSQGSNAKTQQINAPYAGVITTLSVVQGDRVAAGALILQISQNNNLLIQLGVEQDESIKIKPGMPVQLYAEVNGEQSFPGVVSEVHGILNPQTQLVDVVVRIPQADIMHLLPGMRLRGAITVDTIKTWAVPKSAILHDHNGYYIYRVINDIAHRVAVIPGIKDQGFIAIQGDLHPNDRIVILGNYELQDGDYIREKQS